MKEEIKWSKKEVVYRHNKDGNTELDLKVNVYRWKNYRLEKVMYFNHEFVSHRNKGTYYIIKDDLYLCERRSATSIQEVCRYSNIKVATITLQDIIENGLRNEYWGKLGYESYAYDITEQSVDVRQFKVVSNKPLDEETVKEIYRQVSEFKDNTTEDVSEYASELEGTEVRATTTFEYTDYGDDCQIDISDVLYEEKV